MGVSPNTTQSSPEEQELDYVDGKDRRVYGKVKRPLGSGLVAWSAGWTRWQIPQASCDSG